MSYFFVLKMTDTESLCDRCNRFDRPDRSRRAADMIYQEIRSLGDGSVVYIKFSNCPPYACLEELKALLREDGRGIDVREANGVSEGNLFNLSDYCRE
jgi:hypothetical protein